MPSWWQVAPVMMAGEGNYPPEKIVQQKEYVGQSKRLRLKSKYS